ncbi:MAG: DNA gyrase subunit A [Candidatus Portnoybacteria bacterium CG10_big_fil_rev_8_21_14_0_10_36_7]|uniref:DNA gyrase subunit A n=1 Tax=Candidatus Portnoybacteria bacterium CG10_big_fil_rev_8_21_14_0_10_36_7 TaxID=1974812 RepID=A0A2M8KDL0_9BACT|nr:MAG: DNA gyrase subunit A [Candidatus Portnoybacteria bacterium CG10_big_fil_rev_8_21_14_0_10_36_7]
MEIGYVKPREITQEMKDSYLDYAMSVIIVRALPDVRDGLKPVHRRILYAMSELGLHPNVKFRKSATVVGEVLGKYHPHGDSAVYDSMVRMAQDFSLRYQLVEGQGNFGSLDGDNAAAMRYTEARLSWMAEEMLADLDKDTVDWQDNYDGTKQEPKVLPSKVPQLLLNGSMGIAVGMATSIPPHNLGELIEASVHLIDNPKATSDDLMKFVKGPDFPTGGEIFDRKTIVAAYGSGKGPIVMRAKTEIVEGKKSESSRAGYRIIVNEIPYQVNKATLLEKIAELVKEKKLDGIRDVRDETDRTSKRNGLVGVRIVVELKSDASPQRVLNRLYKLTELQKTFHLNMLALVDGMQPQVLSIKNVLEQFLAHRKIVIKRRTEFDLNKAKARAHILEGLKKALDHIDAIISVIKKSADKEVAKENLMKKFKLSDLQSTAILEMKLQTLAGLERKKIEDELAEKKKLIAYLTDILEHPQKMWAVIKQELAGVKEKFGDDRRTKVWSGPVGDISEEDMVTLEDCIIAITQGGYIKRMNPKLYKAQKRGGKGIIGMTTKGEDAVEQFLSASTHDNLLFFTSIGRVFQTKAFEIPESSRVAKGQALVNFLQLSAGETVTAILPAEQKLGSGTQQVTAKYLVMATENGIIKKTPLEDFANVRHNGLIAIKLHKDDCLRWAQPSVGEDEIIFATAKGQSIRFKEKDVRSMGRSASGVKAVKLKKDDYLIGMDIIRKNAPVDKIKLLVLTENGYGKKTAISQFKVQKRGGSGIISAKVTAKTGLVVYGRIIGDEDQELIIISLKGQVIKTELVSVPVLGRATQGVRIMRLEEKDKICSATTF